MKADGQKMKLNCTACAWRVDIKSFIPKATG